MIGEDDPRVVIYRDPFARGELVRRLVDPWWRRPCAWCGSPGRFQYGWESDGSPGRIGWSRDFCSVGCFRAFSE